MRSSIAYPLQPARAIISYMFFFFIYSLWQSIYASTAEAVDAYEGALGAVMQQDMLQKLWME